MRTERFVSRCRLIGAPRVTKETGLNTEVIEVETAEARLRVDATDVVGSSPMTVSGSGRPVLVGL
jgi:hypothetical protein